MSHTYILNSTDDIDELEEDLPIRNMPQRKQSGKPKAVHKPRPAPVAEELVLQGDGQGDMFKFSYQAARHEGVWLLASLGEYYDQFWISDVLRLLKGGKEANVYQCLANPTAAGLDHPYIAAKVYRPRRFRNLKNDYLYREGRGQLDIEGRNIIDDRMQRAMAKRTSYGQELNHTSWIGHEFKTMQVLHAAGADVPVPLTSGNNAILMGYIGDAETPAPTLNSVELDPDEAGPLFERTVRNIEILLANQRVHGDLSAYNILYWEGQITLIDFPQAIDPESNRSAYRIFARDVQRICEYFSRQGVATNPARLAADLWTAYGHRLLPDVNPALLNDEDEKDRAYWQSLRDR